MSADPPHANRVRRGIWAVSIPLLFSLGGCYFVPKTTRGIYLDFRDDQPYAQTANPAAPARVSIQVHGDESHKFLEWPSGLGDWIDSRDVTRRASRHLEHVGVSRQEVRIEPENIDLVSRTPAGVVSPLPLAIEPIWTIVSLDPLILVESPGTIQLFSHIHATPDDDNRQGQSARASVFLNGGFHYGLHMPHTPEPRWTSPEAGERIYDTREVSPTERAIDHPTRPLRLVREGEFWRVELVQQP